MKFIQSIHNSKDELVFINSKPIKIELIGFSESSTAFGTHCGRKYGLYWGAQFGNQLQDSMKKEVANPLDRNAGNFEDWENNAVRATI